jgi:hypothetical protein
MFCARIFVFFFLYIFNEMGFIGRATFYLLQHCQTVVYCYVVVRAAIQGCIALQISIFLPVESNQSLPG